MGTRTRERLGTFQNRCLEQTSGRCDAIACQNCFKQVRSCQNVTKFAVLTCVCWASCRAYMRNRFTVSRTLGPGGCASLTTVYSLGGACAGTDSASLYFRPCSWVWVEQHKTATQQPHAGWAGGRSAFTVRTRNAVQRRLLRYSGTGQNFSWNSEPSPHSVL